MTLNETVAVDVLGYITVAKGAHLPDYKVRCKEDVAGGQVGEVPAVVVVVVDLSVDIR